LLFKVAAPLENSPPLCGYDIEEQRFTENNRFTVDHGAEQEK